MNDVPQTTPEAPSEPVVSNADTRWKFVRDVLVFELKLALNNVHNFVQIPMTLAVAIVDLVFRGKQDGERFYKVVEYGRTIDDSIGIYSIIDHRERSLNSDYTMDAVLKRVEGVIVREFEKGGTATSVKAAVDRAIDEMQARTGPVGDKAEEAIKRAAEKVKETIRERS
ncbi:MAG TPA: hypothetical protein VLV55_12080 [Rhizomicrobium sp.]|nr:hypothetical protein [Rhizomicrobium sp.]